MTKKWSSTRSQDGTKRQASKAARRKEEAEMAKIAEEYGLDPLGDFLRSHLALSEDVIAAMCGGKKAQRRLRR